MFSLLLVAKMGRSVRISESSSWFQCSYDKKHIFILPSWCFIGASVQINNIRNFLFVWLPSVFVVSADRILWKRWGTWGCMKNTCITHPALPNTLLGPDARSVTWLRNWSRAFARFSATSAHEPIYPSFPSKLMKSFVAFQRYSTAATLPYLDNFDITAIILSIKI